MAAAPRLLRSPREEEEEEKCTSRSEWRERRRRKSSCDPNAQNHLEMESGRERGRKVKKAHLVLQDLQDHPALRGPQEYRESQEFQEATQWGHQDHRDQLDLRDLRDHLELREHQVEVREAGSETHSWPWYTYRVRRQPSR